MSYPNERKNLLEKHGDLYNSCLEYIKDRWGFEENEVLSSRRSKPLVDAKEYMAKALYAVPSLSYPMVSVIMKKHHTSVMNLIKRDGLKDD